MVGVLEAGLVLGALGLDAYAYKKMKDAETAAETAVRERERERFKSSAGVHVEVHPEPVAAGAGTPSETDTHVQTALTDHGTDETATAHADWKPVTYESVAPVQTHEEEHVSMTSTENTIDSDEIKKQYQSIAERLDVIDERLTEQDSKISVIETKFEHVDSEVTKNSKQLQTLDEQWRQVDEQLRNVEIPQDQIEVIVDKRFTKSNERVAGQLKDQTKKLAALEAKLDSHIISTPETALIKKDLREEFAPALAEPKRLLEEHAKDNQKSFKALSVRITQARDAALDEAKNKATKTEVRRIVASIKTTAAARKPAAKAAPKTKTAAVKNIVTKKTVTTKTTKALKKTAKTSKKTAEKPKSKLQSAAHEFAKTRKSRKASAGEVTVTTSVPKGVNVKSEVVSGGNSQ